MPKQLRPVKFLKQILTKNMSKIYYFLFFILIGCSAASKKESPTIYFSNASSDMIKNIEVRWALKNVLSLPALSPGDSRTQSFYIKKEDDFFGEVSVSWYNARGEKMSKNFVLRKEHLPSINDKFAFNYAQFYFFQDDVEVISSDIVDINGKTKMMDRMMIKYKMEAEARGIYTACVPSRLNMFDCPGSGAAKTALIRVQNLQ